MRTRGVADELGGVSRPRSTRRDDCAVIRERSESLPATIRWRRGPRRSAASAHRGPGWTARGVAAEQAPSNI